MPRYGTKVPEGNYQSSPSSQLFCNGLHADKKVIPSGSELVDPALKKH